MSRDRGGRRPGHRVVVVGAGWAGLAAALAAREAHAEVVVVDGGVGASHLGPGAIDDLPWEARARAARLLHADLRAPQGGPEGGVGADLAWLLGKAPSAYALAPAGAALPIVATTGGVLRSARGRDAALLDLASLPAGTSVLLPRVDRPGWDADSLRRCLADEARAAGLDLRLEAVDGDVLRFGEERRVGDADLAARHDDPARRAWLAGRLRELLSGRKAAAVLLGPWLGAETSQAAALSAEVGAPVGEVLAPAAGTAGLRFERTRDQLLDAAGCRRERARVRGLTWDEGRARVEIDGADPLSADAVVLAVGGLVGGGIVYAPPEHGAGPEGAETVAPPLRLGLDVALRVEAAGAAGPGSSIFGPGLDALTWPVGDAPGALEACGVREDAARSVSPSLHVAGEVIALRARTVGEAVASGRRAGRAAAQG